MARIKLTPMLEAFEVATPLFHTWRRRGYAPVELLTSGKGNHALVEASDAYTLALFLAAARVFGPECACEIVLADDPAEATVTYRAGHIVATIEKRWILARADAVLAQEECAA